MATPTPLPTTVLAGYLGVGKTTLLNQLLQRAAHAVQGPQRLAVMVNDFGDINIDASLIVDEADSTITLSNGCICCSIGGALYDAIDALLRREQRPDHLLIEASGVAEPARIANIARAEPDLALDATITLIDLEQFPARLADPLINDSVRAQVQQADLLVMTKADLASDEQQKLTRASVAKLAPDKPSIDAVQGHIDPQLLLGIGNTDTTPASTHTHSHADELHDKQYKRWSLQSAGCVSSDELSALLNALPASVLRLKGYIGRSDQTQATLIQGVGARVDVCNAPPGVPNHTQLVAIAQADCDIEPFEQHLRSLIN